jgi:hypothetical protein
VPNAALVTYTRAGRLTITAGGTVVFFEFRPRSGLFNLPETDGAAHGVARKTLVNRRDLNALEIIHQAPVFLVGATFMEGRSGECLLSSTWARQDSFW